MRANICHVLLGMGLALSFAVHAESLRLTVDHQMSEDSDDSTQHRSLLGVRLPLGAAAGTHVETAAGNWRLSEATGSTHFRIAQAELDHRASDRTGLTLSGKLLNGEEWSPVVAAARVTHAFTGPFYAELSASRDLIDTLAAISERWDIRSLSGSLDAGPFHGLLLVGGYTRQELGDDNRRDIFVARLLHEPDERERWLLEARSRWLRSDFDGVGYFSPERLVEHLFRVTRHQPLLDERWVASLAVGVGMQEVNSEGHRRIYSADLSVRGWFSDHFGLNGQLGCTNTGGLSARAARDGYRYCQARLMLMASW
jgi:hypothetical protein